MAIPRTDILLSKSSSFRLLTAELNWPFPPSITIRFGKSCFSSNSLLYLLNTTSCIEPKSFWPSIVLILNFLYNFFEGLPFIKTTHEATLFVPWIFDISKHSMCLGSSFIFKSNLICSIILFMCLSGSTSWVCLFLSKRNAFAFLMDKSNNFLLSPDLGMMNFKLIWFSRLIWLIIFFEVELYFSLILKIIRLSIFSSSSLSFFFTSWLWNLIIFPCATCKKFTKADSESEIMLNTSILLSFELTTVDFDW